MGTRISYIQGLWYISAFVEPQFDHRKHCTCTKCTDCICPVCTKWTKVRSGNYISDPTKYQDPYILLHEWNLELVMQNISELGRWWRSSLAKQPVAITQAYLSSLKEERGKEKLNFVGVHVRRTDYIQLMKTYYQMFESVDEHFFHHCMAEYRRKLGPDTLFLVTSDDIPWCRWAITL